MSALAARMATLRELSANKGRLSANVLAGRAIGAPAHQNKPR
jgi:hypothetical protein